MKNHTSSPQPHAVERKAKYPDNSKSNLAGSEHSKKNKHDKTLIHTTNKNTEKK